MFVCRYPLTVFIPEGLVIASRCLLSFHADKGKIIDFPEQIGTLPSSLRLFLVPTHLAIHQ